MKHPDYQAASTSQQAMTSISRLLHATDRGSGTVVGIALIISCVVMMVGVGMVGSVIATLRQAQGMANVSALALARFAHAQQQVTAASLRASNSACSAVSSYIASWKESRSSLSVQDCAAGEERSSITVKITVMGLHFSVHAVAGIMPCPP